MKSSQQQRANESLVRKKYLAQFPASKQTNKKKE
jgi:hypothetical protein